MLSPPHQAVGGTVAVAAPAVAGTKGENAAGSCRRQNSIRVYKTRTEGEENISAASGRRKM